VLFRPAAQQDIKSFFFVAASPVLSSEVLQREQEELLRQGILDNVSDACTGNVTHARRYRDPEGHLEVLTSITPVLTPAGCWMIVLSHPLESLLGTSIAEPVWMRFEVRVAAAIYVVMAVLTLWVFLSVRRGILRFRALARDLRTGDAGDRSFGSQNELVELSGVADEFDRLIQTLRASADGIRNAAEDNAHAMKTPIAIMRQSLEPLKRIVPAVETRGRRAIAVLENSIDRLDQLVSTARRMDEAMAELLDPPRQRVDLSRLLKRMMVAYGTVIDAWPRSAPSSRTTSLCAPARTCWRRWSRTSSTTPSASPPRAAASAYRCAATAAGPTSPSSTKGRACRPKTSIASSSAASRTARRSQILPPARRRRTRSMPASPVDRPTQHRGDRRPGRSRERRLRRPCHENPSPPSGLAAAPDY
jgi:hypothetical protein